MFELLFESQTYSFTLSLDNAALADIRGAIELVLEDNIPLRALETVFDYQILRQDDASVLVQVVAIAEASVEEFLPSISLSRACSSVV